MLPAIAEIPVHEKPACSRIRVVLQHVLAAVKVPLSVKYGLFVLLTALRLPLPLGILIWAIGCFAAAVFAMRRSVRTIRTKSINRPGRCVSPACLALLGIAFASFLIDTALANIATARPWRFIACALLLEMSLFTFQAFATFRAFASLPGATDDLPFTMEDIYIGFADAAAILIALTILLVVFFA